VNCEPEVWNNQQRFGTRHLNSVWGSSLQYLAISCFYLSAGREVGPGWRASPGSQDVLLLHSSAIELISGWRVWETRTSRTGPTVLLQALQLRSWLERRGRSLSFSYRCIPRPMLGTSSSCKPRGQNHDVWSLPRSTDPRSRDKVDLCIGFGTLWRGQHIQVSSV